MGLAHADLTLENPSRPDVGPVAVRALADTGATFSTIPESVALRLGLDLDLYPRRQVSLADGGTRTVPYVAPVIFRFEGRLSVSPALVMGDDPVLGALQMEDMDLVVRPQRRAVEVNPTHPTGPIARA